ncbi:MAG: hypothetical protein KatS3mg115_0566 [Candidatus Poribacteria bacterium]|nr:MAG: hypothetical protein KatS3mg115_0566 [Candidatus Poribacteria bacterium]
MPAPKTLYFAELGPIWADWIQVVNVGNAPARVTCLARNGEGKAVWSAENTVQPFQGWVPPVEEVKEMTWLEITSDQPIVAERHMHRGSEVIDLPGAAPENKTAGKRLFFAELSAGARDWFRILNINNVEAHVSMIIRNAEGRVLRQLSRVIPPLRWVDITDQHIGDVRGTVEIVSTQVVVAERHLHYQGGKTAVGQLGQVIE